MNPIDDDKSKVRKVVNEKQLFSVMNNTKWRELQNAVVEWLPFPPPYQIKNVLGNEPYPKEFEEDVWYWGDWSEGLLPFYSIEWIRVRPRYLKENGQLLPRITIDITKEFISLLKQFAIPYHEDEDSIYIFGYLHSDDPRTL